MMSYTGNQLSSTSLDSFNGFLVGDVIGSPDWIAMLNYLSH